MRERWLSKRALFLHFLLVTIGPGCLFAGWWQVHRALSGNLLSYFYSVEWPVFAVLAGVAWWQLIHDERPERGIAGTTAPDGPSSGREAGLAEQPLVWDAALETPELTAYNQYLRALSSGRARKTWRNPRGLPGAGSGPEAVRLRPAGEGSTAALGASGPEPRRPGPAAVP